MRGSEIYIYAVPKVFENGHHYVDGNATVVMKYHGIVTICCMSYSNTDLVKQNLLENPDQNIIDVYKNWRPNGYELVWLGGFKSERAAREYIKKLKR